MSDIHGTREELVAMITGLWTERDEWKQAAGVEAGLRREFLAEIERLRAAVKGIAEYCSADGAPLGAVERMVAIRNTAEQALRDHEQGPVK